MILHAVKLQESGKTEEAEALFRKVLKTKPDDFVSRYSLGVIAFQNNDYQTALGLFEESKGLNSRFAPLWYNTGITLGRLGRYHEAIDNFNQAISLDTNYADAITQRDALISVLQQVSNQSPVTVHSLEYSEKILKALELQGCGRLGEAENLFLEVLAVNSEDVPSLYSLGVLEQTKMNPEKALTYFERGLALKPDYAPLWYNRGVILHGQKQHDKAIESYDIALRLNPEYVEAMLNRGVVLVEAKRHKDALLNYEELLKIDPNNDKALCNRGAILTDFKLYDLAIQTYEHLLLVSPDFDDALGLLCFAKLHACDWNNLDTYYTRIFAGIRSGKRVCRSQALLAMSNDPYEHLLCAQIFASHSYPQLAPLWNGEIYEHKKIKIAYVSPDFREHPVGHLTAGIFEAHDKDRFEIVAISLGIDDNSRLRKRMVAAFDEFIDARQMSSHSIAKMLRSMEVDILVDLAGYTADSRPDIFSYRPAPIQVNFLGYSSTMGVNYIDYIIADRFVIPEGARNSYSEKVVYMPDSYLPTDSSVRIAEQTPQREEFGLPSRGVVFCSFNHDYKINPPVFDVWMRLLRQIPNSVLWLMKLNESAERNLRKEAEIRGVDAGRLIFATRVPSIEDHLARYRLADLFLDTTPYNAHTTTSDALRAGLPVVTCMGRAFAGRVAASLLNAVGLSELVTNSLEEYENLALRLAQAPDELADIRDKLRKNLLTSPLYDTEKYCRNIETAYQTMWELYQRGEAPQHFSLQSRSISENHREMKKDKLVILIPVYKATLDHWEQFSIDHLIGKTAGRKLVFIAPEGLDRTYYNQRYNDIEFIVFEDRFFGSIIGYNHLLLDTEFYQTFAEYDYMLIHQTDALLFHDNLDYWMERRFDYIGAPWPNGVEVSLVIGRFCAGNGLNLKAYVGNGGFSLRSTKGAIAVLNEFEEIRDYWLKGGSSEDLFFAFMGMVSDRFAIPNQMVASRFSLELNAEGYFKINNDVIPTGCHAWWKHDLEFWKKIITRIGTGLHEHFTDDSTASAGTPNHQGTAIPSTSAA